MGDEETLRRSILEQAAALHPRIIENNKMLRQESRTAVLKTVCPNYDADLETDDNDLLPVRDAVTLDQIAVDDIVVLSDGQCYSKQSIRALIDSGVINYDTGRATLPITGRPMADVDYVLVGALPPREGSDALVQARLRTQAVNDATVEEAVRTRAQVAEERRARAQLREARRRQYATRMRREFQTMRTIRETDDNF